MDDYNKKYLQLDLLGEHVGTKKKPQTIHLLVFVMHHSLVLAGVLLVHLLQLLVALLSNYPTFPEKRQKVFFYISVVFANDGQLQKYYLQFKETSLKDPLMRSKV